MSDTDENDLTVVQQQPAAFATTEQDPMTRYTALAEKEASAAPAELRPPAEHAEKQQHWLLLDHPVCRPTVWQWADKPGKLPKRAKAKGKK